jgi:hypothetical protein
MSRRFLVSTSIRISVMVISRAFNRSLRSSRVCQRKVDVQNATHHADRHDMSTSMSMQPRQ